ncbi:AraC family transcriptional regulator [Nonomuraea sp. NPDC050790]|uniref:AraC family transcriptional regulator n=1 Tax=Nonomuraea sp. NPDC050790 TaxID=3364371 RepID=UPI0037A4839E
MLVDEMHELVTQHFAPHRLRVRELSPDGARYRPLHQGALTTQTLAYGAEISVSVRDLEEFYIHVPLRGHGRLSVGRRELCAPITVIGPGQRPVMNWSVDHEILIVRVPQTQVERTLADYLSGPAPRVPVFEPEIGRDGPFGGALRGLAEGTLSFTSSPLAAHHMEQFLLHTMVASHAGNFAAAVAAPAPPAGQAALRRARRYCEDHAGEPVSLRDIAAAARVSVRTLQTSFREHMQTTPMAYLREVRLARAHADLRAIAESGASTSVTDVALRWGFPHLSRFAAHYHRRYGELPSATRRTP